MKNPWKGIKSCLIFTALLTFLTNFFFWLVILFMPMNLMVTECFKSTINLKLPLCIHIVNGILFYIISRVGDIVTGDSNKYKKYLGVEESNIWEFYKYNKWGDEPLGWNGPTTESTIVLKIKSPLVDSINCKRGDFVFVESMGLVIFKGNGHDMYHHSNS